MGEISISQALDMVSKATKDYIDNKIDKESDSTDEKLVAIVASDEEVNDMLDGELY